MNRDDYCSGVSNEGERAHVTTSGHLRTSGRSYVGSIGRLESPPDRGHRRNPVHHHRRRGGRDICRSDGPVGDVRRRLLRARRPATPPLSTVRTSGFAVTVVDVTTATPAAAAACTIWWSSVRRLLHRRSTTSLRRSATPIVTWEGYVYGTLQLTSGAGGNQGESSPSRTIDIVDPSHPIAAGLSGRPVITSANTAQAYGRPAGSAHVIAAITGQRANAAIFTYDTGDQMFSLAAPARRVGLPLSYGSPPRLYRERVGDLRRRYHLGAR